MIHRNIHFKSAHGLIYKYELIAKVETQTDIIGRGFEKPYIHLNDHGLLTQFPGYRWDGCSGPTIDTEKWNWFHGSTMHAGCAHDGLYQALRESWMIPQRLMIEPYYRRFRELREKSDDLFGKLLKADGVWYPRRKLYHSGVRLFGESSALPEKLK